MKLVILSNKRALYSFISNFAKSPEYETYFPVNNEDAITFSLFNWKTLLEKRLLIDVEIN